MREEEGWRKGEGGREGRRGREGEGGRITSSKIKRNCNLTTCSSGRPTSMHSHTVVSDESAKLGYWAYTTAYTCNN